MRRTNEKLRSSNDQDPPPVPVSKHNVSHNTHNTNTPLSPWSLKLKSAWTTNHGGQMCNAASQARSSSRDSVQARRRLLTARQAALRNMYRSIGLDGLVHGAQCWQAPTVNWYLIPGSVAGSQDRSRLSRYKPKPSRAKRSDTRADRPACQAFV